MDENKLTDLNTVPQEKPKENVDNASTENPFAPKPYQFSVDDLKTIGSNIKKREEYEAQFQAQSQAKLKEFNFGLSNSLNKLLDIVYPKTTEKVEEWLTPDELKEQAQLGFSSEHPLTAKPTRTIERVTRKPVPLWKLDDKYRQDSINAAKEFESYIASKVGDKGLKEFYKSNPEIYNTIVELRNSLSDENWKKIKTEQDYEAYKRTSEGVLSRIPFISEFLSTLSPYNPPVELIKAAEGKSTFEQAKIFSPTFNFLNTVEAESERLVFNIADGLAKLITAAEMPFDTDEETSKKFGNLLTQSKKTNDEINAFFGIKENPYQIPFEELIKQKRYWEAVATFAGDVPQGTATQTPQILAMLYGGVLTARFPSLLRHIGPAAATFPIHLSEVFNETIKQNQESTSPRSNLAVVTKSLLASSVNTALDLVSFEILFGKLLRKTNPSFKNMSSLELQKAANQSLSKAAIKQILQFGGTEIPTEILQEMSKRWAAGLPLFDDNAIAIYTQTAYAVATSFPLSGLGVVANIQEKETANAELIYRQLTDTSRFSFEAEAEINNAPSAAFNYNISLGPTLTPQVTVQQQVQPTEQVTTQAANQIDLLSEARTWIQQQIEEDNKVSSTYSQNEIASFVNNLTPIEVAKFIQSKYVNGAEGFVNQVMSDNNFNKTDYDFSKDKYWNSKINNINYADIISGKLPEYKDYLNKSFSNKNVIESQQTSIEIKSQPQFNLLQSTFSGSTLSEEAIRERLNQNDEGLRTGNYYKKPSTAKIAFDYLGKNLDKPSFQSLLKQIKSNKLMLISNMDDLPSWYSRDSNIYGPETFVTMGYNDRIHNNSLVILTDNIWNYIVKKYPNAKSEDIVDAFNKTIFETMLHENSHSFLVVYSKEEYAAIMQKVKNLLMNYDAVPNAFNSELHENFIRLLSLYNAGKPTRKTTGYIAQLITTHNNIISFLNNNDGLSESLEGPHEILKRGLDNLNAYNNLINEIKPIIENTNDAELINAFNSIVESKFFKNTIENLINGQTNPTTKTLLKTALSIVEDIESQGFMEEVLAYTLEKADPQLIDKNILDYKDYIKRLGKKFKITKSNMKTLMATSIKASKRTYVSAGRYKINSNEFLVKSYPTPSKVESIDDFVKLLALNTMNTKLSSVESSIFSPNRFKTEITGDFDTIYTLDESEIRRLNRDVEKASKLYASLYTERLSEEDQDFLDEYSESQNKFYFNLKNAGIVPGVWIKNDSNNDVSRYVGAKITNGLITLSLLSKPNKYEVDNNGFIIYDTRTEIGLEVLSNYTVLSASEASFYSNAENYKEQQKLTDTGIGRTQFEVSEQSVRDLYSKYFPDEIPNSVSSMWFTNFIKSIKFKMSSGGNKNISSQVWMKSLTPKFFETVIKEISTERKEELWEKRKSYEIEKLDEEQKDALKVAENRYIISFEALRNQYTKNLIDSLTDKIKAEDKKLVDITNEQLFKWLTEYSFTTDEINALVEKIENSKLSDEEFKEAKINILNKAIGDHYTPIVKLEMGYEPDWIAQEYQYINDKIEEKREELKNKKMPSSWVVLEDITKKINEASEDSIYKLKNDLVADKQQLIDEMARLPEENRTEEQEIKYKQLEELALKNAELQAEYNDIIASFKYVDSEKKSSSQLIWNNTAEKMSAIGYAFTEILTQINAQKGEKKFIKLSMSDELLINNELNRLETEKVKLLELLKSDPQNENNITSLNKLMSDIDELNSLKRDLVKRRKEHLNYLNEIDKRLSQEISLSTRTQLEKEKENAKNFDDWHKDNIMSRYLGSIASFAYLKLLSLDKSDAMYGVSARIVNEISEGEKNVLTEEAIGSYTLPSVTYEDIQKQKFSPTGMLGKIIEKKRGLNSELARDIFTRAFNDEVNTTVRFLLLTFPEKYKIPQDAIEDAKKIIKKEQKIPTVDKFLVIDVALEGMRQRIEFDTNLKKENGPDKLSSVYSGGRTVDAALKLRKIDAVTIAFWDTIKQFTSPNVDKYIEITTKETIIDKDGKERTETKKEIKKITNEEYKKFIEKSDKDSRGRYTLEIGDNKQIEAKNAFSLALFAKNERKNNAASKIGTRLFAGINKSTEKIIKSLNEKITTTQEEISKIKTNIEKRKRGEGIIRNGVKTVNFDTTKLERDLSEKLSILEKLESDKKYQEETEFNLKWDYYLSPEEKRTLSIMYAINLEKYGIGFDYIDDYKRLIENIAIPSIQGKVNKFYNYMYGYLNALSKEGFENRFPLSHTNEMMTTVFDAAESGDYSRIMYKKGVPSEPSGQNVTTISSIGIADIPYVDRIFRKEVSNAIGTGIITGLGVYSYTNDARILSGLSFGDELLSKTALIGATLGGLYIINNDSRQKMYMKAVLSAASRIKDPKEKAKFIARVLADKRFGFSEVEKYELLRFQDKWSSLTQQLTISANALEKELASASMHGDINLGIDYTKAVMYARLVNQYLDPTDEIINNSLLTGPDKELSLLPMAQEIYNDKEFETAKAALKSFIELKLKTLSETSSEKPEEQNFIKIETERMNTIYDIWFGFTEEAQVKALVKWENALSRLLSNPSYITGFPTKETIKELPKEALLTDIALKLRKKKILELQEQAYSKLPDSAKPFAKEIKTRLEFISQQLLLLSQEGFDLGAAEKNKNDEITKLPKEIEIERKLGEYLPIVYEAFDSHDSWLLQPDFQQREEEFKREFFKHFYEVTIKNQKTKIINQEVGRKNYKTGEIVPAWGEIRVKKFLARNDTKANSEKINEFLKSLTPDEAKVVNELLSAIDNLTMHEKDNAERKKQTPAETRFANRKKALKLDVLLKLANRGQKSLNDFTIIVDKIKGKDYLSLAKETAHNSYIPSKINKAIFEDKNIKLLDSYQKFLGKLENPWQRAAVGSAKNIVFLSSVTFQKHLRSVLIKSGFASENASEIFTETFTQSDVKNSLALAKASQFGFLNKLFYTPYGKFLTLAWIENDVERNWYSKSIGFIKFQQVILNSATWMRQIISDGLAAITLGYKTKNPYDVVRLLSLTLQMQKAYKYGSPVVKTQKFKNSFRKLLNKEVLDKFSVSDKNVDPVDVILNQIMGMGVFKENIVTEDILSNLGANQPLFSEKKKFKIYELIKLLTTKQFKKEPFMKTQTEGMKESKGFTREMISRIGYFFGTTNNASRLGVLLNFLNEFSKTTLTPTEIVSASYALTHRVVPRFETYPEMIKLASRYGILNPFIFFEIMGTRAIFNQFQTISELQNPQTASKWIGREVTEDEGKQLKNISGKLLISLIVGLGINYLLLHTRMFSGDEDKDKDKLSENEKKNIDKLVSGYFEGKTYDYELDRKKMEISIINNEYATYFSPLIWGTEYGIIGLSEIIKEINQDGSWDYEKSRLDGGVGILEKAFRQKLAEGFISPVMPLASAITTGRDFKTGQILDEIKDEGRETTILGRVIPAVKLTAKSMTPPDIKRLNKIQEDKMNFRDWLELALFGRSTTTFKYKDFWNSSIYQESQAFKNQIAELNKRAFEIEPGESLKYSIKELSPSYINYRNAIISRSDALFFSGIVKDKNAFVQIITGDYGRTTPLINDSELQVYSVLGTRMVTEALTAIPNEKIKQWSLTHFSNEIPIDKQVDIISNQFEKRLNGLFSDGRIASIKQQNGRTNYEYLWENFNIDTKQKIAEHFNAAFPWLYSSQRMNEEKDIDDMYTYNSILEGEKEIRILPDVRSLDNLKKDLINNPYIDDDYSYLEDPQKIQAMYRIKYEINKHVEDGNRYRGKLMVNEKGEFYFTGTEEEKRSMEKVLQFHLLKTFMTDSQDVTKKVMGFNNFSSMNEVGVGFFDREKQVKSKPKNEIYLSEDGEQIKTINTRQLFERILKNQPEKVIQKTKVISRNQ